MMFFNKVRNLFLLVSLISGQLASAALVHTSNDLALKDFEDMQKLVHKIKGQPSLDDDPAVSRQLKLEQALQLIMARRDSDGSREKLFFALKGDLQDDEAEAVQNVVSQSIEGMNDKSLNIRDRATHTLILLNLLSEIRFDLTTFKVACEQIRDAKLEIGEDLSKSMALNGDKVVSPSAFAAQILTQGMSKQ